MTRAEIVAVRLNAHELRMVALIAIEHHVENVIAGRHDTAWGNGLDLTARARAYWAEYAVAKELRLPWEPKTWEGRKDGDVAGVEVRSIPKRAHPKLAIRPRDLSDEVLRERPFVLVVADEPSFFLTGWCYAEEAPKLGVEESPDPSKPPALFIPWENLRPLATLGGTT